MLRIFIILLMCIFTLPALAEKPAPPARPELEAATKKVRELFKAEYASVAAADQDALALKLLEMARDMKDDPTAEYAMLNEAVELATRAADSKAAMSAVQILGERFNIDASAQRNKTAVSLGRAVRTKEQASRYLECVLPLIEKLAAESRWDDAMPMVRLVQVVAQANPEAERAGDALENVQVWTKQQVEYARLKGSLAKLSEDPTNPPANTAVGKYYALVREEWEKAVPLLSKGEDAPMKAAAEHDLATMATAWGESESDKKKLLAAQLKAGDLWMSAAAKAVPPARPAVARRALAWYRKAEPSLTGLDHLSLMKKIEDARQVVVGPRKPTFLLDLTKEQVASVAKFRDKYYLPVLDEKNFEQAEAWAQEHGAHLVCVMDQAENDFVRSLVKQGMSRSLLIGALDARKEGRWSWVDGSEMRFTNWARGQPDNWHGEERWCCMWSDGHWNDIDAKWRGAFVVQWKAN